MQNDKEMKRNEAKKAKWSETKEAKQKKQSEKHILKRNKGKTASIYFKYRSEMKRKEK